MKTQMTRNANTATLSHKTWQARALAGVFGLFLCAAVPVAAHANDINFTYNNSCDASGSCSTNLTVPSVLGMPASDNIAITFANGLSITGGTLAFTSPGATQITPDGFGFDSQFNNGGGSFSISGTVPGLTSATTLLSGYFLSGGTGVDTFNARAFNSPLDVTYVDPTLLHDLGMDATSPYGTGELSDSYFLIDNGQQYAWDSSVTLNFTPSPEPGSLALLGSGILGLSGVLRKRMRRDG